MRQIMFAIFDTKAEAYMVPFFCPTVGLAERSFSASVNDTNHHFHTYAADFTLFELGHVDQTTGTIEPHPTPINRGQAIHFMTNGLKE